MKSFLKTYLASFLSGLTLIIIGAIIFFIVIVAGVTAAFSSATGNNEEITVESSKSNTVLNIKFNKPISDVGSANFNPSSFNIDDNIGLNTILFSIKKATEDRNIKGIILNIDQIQAGYATTFEIRNALKAFKNNSQKFIYAYSTGYSQKGYYLSSIADSIFVYPEGMIQLTGLSMDQMFFKDMLGKIGVEMQVIRGKNNKFKSAVEPYINNTMSEANREQSSKFLNSIWTNMLDSIATERGLSTEEIQSITNDLILSNIKETTRLNIADQLVYGDELDSILTKKLNVKSIKDINFLSFDKYAKSQGKQLKQQGVRNANIAIIYAEGEIKTGKSDENTIGSKTLASQIRQARLDDNIKAIVLRVNSPGGSALASDIIWREAYLAKKTKPLVVSMGDVAASGGYYISCAADKIFATPNTITGSIGVFGLLPNAQKLFEDKLGIHFDGVKTADHADLGSIYRPLTASEFNIIQESVESVYHTFLTRVTDGRATFNSNSEVDKIAQGRVWSGIDALKIGLIDELGGIDKAVESAAVLAGINNPKSARYPKVKKGKFEDVIEIFNQLEDSETISVKASNNIESKIMEDIKDISSILNNDQVQTRLPFIYKM